MLPRRTAPALDAPLTAAEAAPLLEPYLADRAGGGVVLAVSGGPDSVALMRLAAAVVSARRVPVTVGTVDHGLRPEADAEANAVAGWARACGFPHRVLAWTGLKPASGRPAAAREARYRLLAELARSTGSSHVLTAHHADDQAETILLRLCRGSGPAGLAGMDRETVLHGVTVARPFLGVRKARLVASCRAGGWPFLDDPSNADPRFTRTRLRRLLPLLEAEGLTPDRLPRLAGRLRRWREAVDRAADRAFEATAAREGEGLVLDGTQLLAEPEEILVGVLSRAVAAVAPGPRRQRLERFETLADAVGAALRDAVPFRANLGGALVEAGPDRWVVVRPEPPRRAPADADAAGAPHSLGTDSGGP